MITESQAYKLMSPLTAAFAFTNETTALWVNMLEGLEDAECAQRAIKHLVKTAENRYVPGWGLMQAAYNREVAKKAETGQEYAEIEEEGSRGRFITPAEGMKIASAAYEEAYGRPMTAFGLPDPDETPKSTPEDVEIAVSVLKRGRELHGTRVSSYVEVLRAFNGDHRRSRAVLRSMEQSRTVIWNNNGTIVLKSAS